MLERLYQFFSHDIGVDLGTANTLVYVKGKGIIMNEPSVVALNKKTGQVVAIGNEAKEMLGRTPGHLQAVRPLVDGVISDFEVTEEMLTYFLSKAVKGSRSLFGPRVVIGIPSQITNVQIRAVRDAAQSAGARQVYIVEEPMAAAIGIRLPIFDPVGSMVIDIGGGTSDIAVISLGGIVNAKSLRIAGDKLNDDIISYIRDEFKILIGERTAEDVKMSIGTAMRSGGRSESSIRGRDLATGLPKEVAITEADIHEALSNSISHLVEAVKEVLETTPPELLADIMQRGIVLVGGGAMLPGLAALLEKETNIPVHITDDPLTAVVRGTGVILEDIEKYREVLIENEDELPPQ